METTPQGPGNLYPRSDVQGPGSSNTTARTIRSVPNLTRLIRVSFLTGTPDVTFCGPQPVQWTEIQGADLAIKYTENIVIRTESSPK